MKRFLVIYNAPAEAMAAMATATPDEKMEGIKPWMAWKETMGDKVIDFGAPLLPGQRIAADGTSKGTTHDTTGYSIIEAEDMNAAKAALNSHPHLAWTNGCAIEVYEFARM